MPSIQNSVESKDFLISVIIPVYNKVGYIRECVESVLSQTYANIEIIVVNDGSTDDSISILEEYSESCNYFYIINKKNSGLSSARNSGLDASNGKYVFFHDADDVLNPNSISELLHAAIIYGSDVVGGVFERDSGALIKKFYFNDCKMDFIKNEGLAIKYATNFSSCNKLFKREFLNKNELRFTPDLYMQDIEFWLKVMFTSRNISQIKSVVSVYRDVPSSSSKSATDSRFKSLFDLFYKLRYFNDEIKNKICSLVIDMAYMQGAVIFFARWKLNEYMESNNIGDLEKINKVLNLIEGQSFFRYLLHANNGRAIFLILLRNKMYSEAYRLSLDFSLLTQPKDNILDGNLKSIANNSSLLINRPSIIIFCGPLVFGKGGMEKVASELANFLVSYGLEVSIGYFSRGRQKPSYFLREEISHIPWNRNKETVNDYRNKIIEARFDAAISFTASSQVIQVLSVFYETQTALILHEGSNPERIITDNWAVPRRINYNNAAIEREAVLSAATQVRMTLDEHALSLPDFIKNKTKAFANAFPMPEVKKGRSEELINRKRIINIGGMKPNKNIFPLIDAFSLLKDKFPDWEVIVFSAKYKSKQAVEYMDEVNIKIKEKELGDVFIIRDEVDDLDKEYSLSNIHVITSLSEGFGNCVAESMTHGVPSIGYKSCPGVRSLIQHNKNGFLVSEESGDLVNALDILMTSDGLRERLGDNAREIAKDAFNPNAIYQNWLNLIYHAVSSENKWFANLNQDQKNKYKPLVDKLTSEELIDKRERTLKIAIFGAGNLFKVGGLQRSYQILTEHLAKAGHEVTLFSWLQPGKNGKVTNTDLAYPINDDVKVELIPQKADFSNFQLVENKLIEASPDIAVIVNSSQMSFFLAMVCAKNNIPFIQSLRGSTEYCLKYLWPCKFLMDSVFHGSLKGHVLMPSYVNIFPEEIKDKITVIPSQIEPSYSLANVEDANFNNRFVILYSGRFSFEKRVDYLIRAFSILSKNYDNWDLWLYGTGPLENEHKNLVNQLGLQDRVIFGIAKNTDEMYKVYPCVNIKVLPSEQEGCPMALREAMIHGIPVVAYKECSGSNEIIENGKSGFLVDYDFGRQDQAIEELYKKIKNLVDNPDLRVEMGKSAFEKAKEYNPLIINSQWESLIFEAVKISRDKRFSNSVYAFREFAKSCLSKKRFRDVSIFKRDYELFKNNINEYLSVYSNDLFDRKYYLETYLEVKISGADPLLHYITEGWLKGYNPSPYFDNNSYIEKYGGLVCPLVHYYSTSNVECLSVKLHDQSYISRNPNKKINW